MVVIYNRNGTIDFLATRECLFGNLCEEDLEANSSEEEFWDEWEAHFRQEDQS